jgi:hypothetical protein
VVKLPVEGPALFDFSADGQLLGVAGPDGVRLWETATGKEAGRVPVSGRGAAAKDRACATALAFAPGLRTLATGHADSTILLWDATLGRNSGGRPLTEADADALWADLAGDDAARAYRAAWRLADDPGRAVPLLRERLKPVAAAPTDTARALVKDLDSDRFAVREKADKQLRDYGERARPALRAALDDNPSTERKRRLEVILAALGRPEILRGEPLRAVRAVRVLEAVGTPEAQGLLQRLAGGLPEARLTREAKMSLVRLAAGQAKAQ